MSRPIAPEAVSVVGLGMVAALGPDVLTNCAAARAGLVRSSVVQTFHARSEVDGAAEPIVGHQAALFTRGFEGETRLLRLVHGAVQDLLAQTSQVAWTNERATFYVSLPPSNRTDDGLDLIADEATREVKSERIAGRQNAVDLSAAERDRAVRIVSRAARLAGWPTDPIVRYVSVAGHAGGAAAIGAAMADLATATTRVAIVVGVDSWLDEVTLEWLQSCGRLKCDGNPVGIQPGEAGVALALSTPATTSETAPALITRVVTSREPKDFLSGACPAGEALAYVVSLAWNECASDASDVPWILSDQSGEVYRATDWGHAAVRLRARFASFADPVVWYPAIGFGDTGAASVLVGVCVAVRAWVRCYAPAPRAIVLAASDGGERAAVTLECRAG